MNIPTCNKGLSNPLPTLSFEELNDKSNRFPILQNILRSDLVELYGCQEENIKSIGKQINHLCEVIISDNTPAGFLVWKIEKLRDFSIISNLHVISNKASIAQEIGNILIERALLLGTENQATQIDITLHERDLNLINVLISKGFRQLKKSTIKSSDVFKYFFTYKLIDQTEKSSNDLFVDQELGVNADLSLDRECLHKENINVKKRKITDGKPPLHPDTNKRASIIKASKPILSIPIRYKKLSNTPPQGVVA